MSGFSTADGVAHPDAGASHVRNPLSVPYLVLAAALAGLGIFLTTLWVVTFYWFLFPGILLVVVGALMLFSPLAGANSA